MERVKILVLYVFDTFDSVREHESIHRYFRRPVRMISTDDNQSRIDILADDLERLEQHFGILYGMAIPHMQEDVRWPELLLGKREAS